MATISVPGALRDRLRTFGGPGMTDPDIIGALMDRVQREDFVRDLRNQYQATPRKRHVDLDDR